MSAAKHTPGPWTFSWSMAGKWLVYIGKHLHALEEEREADARLIAAAPELLAALQRAVNEAVADELDPWFANARAIIAKATGGAA